MRHVTLDGMKMIDKYATHEYMHQKLMLPDYYGHNLDALYDVLTVHNKDLTVTLINKPELIDYLGEYGEDLIKTFQEAAKVNEKVTIKVI